MVKKRHATHEDYVELVKDTFGEVKRDIFTGDLHIWDKIKKRWVPLLGTLPLGKLRARIRDFDDGWSVSALEDHINGWTMDSLGEMLVHIPEWDGEERLKVFARDLHCASYTQDEVEDILKAWGANMFRRLADPQVQNQIIILLGKQGLGKDTWIKQMLRGLDHYMASFVVTRNEVDTLSLVTSHLCIHIEEFDRVHKMDPATIKAIITGESFQFRTAYERKAERRTDRASFIGSCNTSDILREPGANRRFIVLDVEKIGRTYPLGESLQVLAEWRRLNKDGYKIRPETQETIARVIQGLTPVDLEEEVINHYLELTNDIFTWDRREFDGIESVLSSKMGNLWKDLQKDVGHNIHTLKSIVKRNGFGHRTRSGSFFFKQRIKVINNQVYLADGITPRPASAEPTIQQELLDINT